MQGGDIATITLEEAQGIISAAQQKAQEIDQPMNIAVIDNGRNLKAFARMEDAWLGSIDIAHHSRRTNHLHRSLRPRA